MYFLLFSLLSLSICYSETPPSPVVHDVIIVGAGISGLYAGYSIKKQTPDLSFLVLEKQNRVGGRIHSQFIDFPDGNIVKEEDGGMRFLINHMDNLAGLLLELDLTEQLIPFPMNSHGNNRYFIRNHNFSIAEIQKKPQKLTRIFHIPSQKKHSIEEFQEQFIQTIFDQNNHFVQQMGWPNSPDPNYWWKFAKYGKYNGTLISSFDIRSLLRKTNVNEGVYQLLDNFVGLDPIEYFQNFFTFRDPNAFFTLKEGYNQLIIKIEKEINKHIHLNQTVTHIEKTQEGYFKVWTQTQEKKGVYLTKKVILALPKEPLKKIFSNSNLFSNAPENKDKLKKNLNSVDNIPLAKINLFYSSAWWANIFNIDQSIEYGFSRSDTPLTSSLPFYSINDEATIAILDLERLNENKLSDIPTQIKNKIRSIKKQKFISPSALTLYIFGKENIRFWRLLQQSSSSFRPHFSIENINPASKNTIFFASDLLQKIYLKQPPLPLITSVTIWDGKQETFVNTREHQNTYAIHSWKPHVNRTRIQKELIEPVKNIYTCGEAYSDYHGWIEGALRSTNLVLEKAFHISSISKRIKEKSEKTTSELLKKAYKEHAKKRIKKHLNIDLDPSSNKKT